MPEPQIALKVAYLGPAMNANPYFETTASPWTALGGTVARSTAQAHEGVASLLLTPDGVSSLSDARTENVPATVGTSYRASAWARCAVSRNVNININWRSSGGGILSTSTFALAVTAGTWTLLEVSATAPALTTQAQLTVAMGSTPPASNTLHIDEAVLLPNWTDLAGRLLYGDGGGPLTIDIGRQTELQDVEPTRIAAVLKNGDGWLNPRNPSSPYYGTWEQGRQVRVTETVDGEDIDLATGYLEIPDVQVNSPNVDQPCSISAVDRLGRLAGAAPFDGTLAEHIRTNGGRLAEWFPLSETASNGQYLSPVTGLITNRIVKGFGGQAPIAAEPDALIKTAEMAGPPGDDQSYANWAPVGDADGLSTFAQAELRAPCSITAGLSELIAVSAWVNFQDYNMAPTSVEPQGWTVNLQNSNTHQMSLMKVFITGSTFYNGTRLYHPQTGGSTVWMDAGRPYEKYVWRLVTARYNLTTGLYELFVGADVAVSTTVTPPTAPITFTELNMGLGWSGGIANVQIRVGPAATTMTRAMHLAQYDHGYRGLHRQTVAERIATLAGYAGVPASDLELPAEASTPMQRAELGGTNPASAMQDAATAGQDTLMTTAQGRITLVPRGRRYNQPVAMDIPFGWLSRGGIRYRPDKPVTDTVATQAGGGSARRIDQTARARYGVLARTVTLDTAIDADVTNWAVWTLAAGGQPRTRCPLLRIDMLKRALADRKALLKLRVGDRIQLTGMPANSPEDVPHLIVQGIRHIIGPHRKRLIEFNTSPLLGPTPGVPPACPVVGDLVSNTAIVAY